MTGTAAKQRWRILRTGVHDAYWNMALDEVLFRTYASGNASPVFRVYEWKHPAITIGHYQRASDTIDLEACAVDSIEVTRRLTGGRAVFHTCEVGYSVIGSIGDSVFGGSIRDTYRAINKVIVSAYCSLGIDAEEGMGRTVTRIPAGLRYSASCFASPTPFELITGDVKLAGGAQRRFDNAFLQQGTVRLGSGAERIADYLSDHEAAAIVRRVLEPDSVLQGIETSPAAMTGVLVEMFTRTVDSQVADDSLNPNECDEAERLSNTRYHAKGWIDGTGCEPGL